jgi:hypothetical protein
MIFVFSGRNLSATLALVFIGIPSFASAADRSSKPEASVPSVTYRSVFRETSLGVESDKVDWRKANDDVGKFTRGHVDILKQEEMDGKAMPAKPATPAAPHKH